MKRAVLVSFERHMSTPRQTAVPESPESYPRRVLLAVSGVSPQIVTETVYALAVAREPRVAPCRQERYDGVGQVFAQVELTGPGPENHG